MIDPRFMPIGHPLHPVPQHAMVPQRAFRALPPAGFHGVPPVLRNPLLAIVGNPPVLRNPLLAIVGNPPRQAFQAGRQASCPFVNLALWEAEAQLAEAEMRAVAGAGRSRRVKAKGSDVVTSLKIDKRVLKNRTTGPGSKPVMPIKTFELKDASTRFDGFNKAMSAYRRFHDRNPGKLDVYAYDDGRDEVTVDRVHAALHRTIDTNYFVPWDSNKRKNRWKHEHVEGYDLSKNGPLPSEENFPLEVLDPVTGTTRKIAGRFKVSDWWWD